MNWINVSDKMPETQKTVYVVCEADKYPTGKRHFQTMAQYIPPMTVRECDFMAEDFHGYGDYSEELDEFFTPEGWYEWQSEPEMNYKISANVTHWMPQLEFPNT